MTEIEQRIIEIINEGHSDFYAHKLFPQESFEIQLQRFKTEAIPFLEKLRNDGEIEIIKEHPISIEGNSFIDCVLIRVLN